MSGKKTVCALTRATAVYVYFHRRKGSFNMKKMEIIKILIGLIILYAAFQALYLTDLFDEYSRCSYRNPHTILCRTH